jgi:hypothetical protein
LEEGKGVGGGLLPDGGDGPEEGGRVGGAARWHSSPRSGPDPPPLCVGGLAPPPPLIEFISIVGPPPPPCAGGPAPLLHRSSSSLSVLLLRASTSGLLLPCHASHHRSSAVDEGMRENTVGSAFSSPVPANARPHTGVAGGATVPPPACSLCMRTAMRRVLEMVSTLFACEITLQPVVIFCDLNLIVGYPSALWLSSVPGSVMADEEEHGTLHLGHAASDPVRLTDDRTPQERAPPVIAAKCLDSSQSQRLVRPGPCARTHDSHRMGEVVWAFSLYFNIRLLHFSPIIACDLLVWYQSNVSLNHICDLTFLTSHVTG